MVKFQYLTCCVNSDADSIHAMTEQAIGITLHTFRRRCDTREWEEDLGYERRGRGLPMSRDWHVRYFKSIYRGRPCYYAVHSAIEHIFVNETDSELSHRRYRQLRIPK